MLPGLVLGEMNPALNVRQQRAAQNLFKDQIESVLLFEEFYQLDDVRVALAVMECLHLFEDTIAAVAWHFFDYLYEIMSEFLD